MMKLSELKKGDKASIVSISSSNNALKRRMLDMGITTGAFVEVSKVAPLGDPIEITIRGYELTLRQDEAKLIEVSKHA